MDWNESTDPAAHCTLTALSMKKHELKERLHIMKIAIFAPYFTKPGGTLPIWFEYWQKTASYNSGIDFFVPTNVDISQYKKYENIHFICMSAEEFWGKLDTILGFKVYRGYYKTTEYRVFFGILFKDVIQEYDYWGTSEFDVIYGDIMKYLRPYIESGEDVIGKDAHLRLIKNTDKLRNLPFEEAKGFEHPLNYEAAFSTEYCWYFVEGGMNLRYQQAAKWLRLTKTLPIFMSCINIFCVQVKRGDGDFLGRTENSQDTIT